MGNISYFKQLTTYAIPFLLITLLGQLEEHFFLKHDDDFFVKGMYTSISSRAKNTTTTNNIWMMLNPSVGKNSKRADSLSFFEPKQREEVCVTLREWVSFILKCEYEPPTLDATSKAILKQSHLKKKKYEMLNDDLRWNSFHKEPEKKSKAKTAPINVTKITNKDLYLNLCQALIIGATNTKSKHDKLINDEGILSMVEIVGRKFSTTCYDIKEAIKLLSAETIAEKLAAENLAEIPAQAGINTIGSHNSDLSSESDSSDTSLTSTENSKNSSSESNSNDSEDSDENSEDERSNNKGKDDKESEKSIIDNKIENAKENDDINDGEKGSNEDNCKETKIETVDGGNMT